MVNKGKFFTLLITATDYPTKKSKIMMTWFAPSTGEKKRQVSEEKEDVELQNYCATLIT